VALVFVAVLPWAEVARGDRTTPYGQLAQSTYTLFDQMVRGLRRFHEGTQPHEAKALRRLIGDVWYHLDIFAYAYPRDQKDLLVQLLAELNRGYDAMGDFKDLFDRQLLEISSQSPLASQRSRLRPIQYDPADVKKARNSVLEWRQKFLEPGRLEVYDSYLRNPNATNVFIRPKHLLSKCYWGAVTVVPSPDRSGSENLKTLMIALLEKLQSRYATIQGIDDLFEGNNHDTFHDFRVRVRCLLSIVSYFPSVTAEVRGAGVTERRLTELVDRYGDLNDTIMAADVATSKGQKSRAEQLRRQISQEWSEIKDWQTNLRIKGQLGVYADRLRQATQEGEP